MRVRGGHNFFRVRVSDKEVLAISEKLDVLVALNRETIEFHESEVKSGGGIIFDREGTKMEAKGAHYFDLPLARLAEESVKNKLLADSAAVGAALGLAEYDFDLLQFEE